MRNTYKGRFKPKNPVKYKGNPSNIIYRSSWELKLMMRLDEHPSVIWWNSEEMMIPYRSPIDNKIHRYFPDFLVSLVNRNGVAETLMIEVKPYAQTREPTKQGKKPKTYITEVMTWGVNQSKWRSADQYCKDRGWRFEILTEKQLFAPNNPII